MIDRTTTPRDQTVRLCFQSRIEKPAGGSANPAKPTISGRLRRHARSVPARKRLPRGFENGT